MPQGGSIWDDEIWTEIDIISDPAIRNVLRRIYRIILEMYNAEQLAKAVAIEVSRREKRIFTTGQKFIATIMGILIAVSTILNIIHVT